MTRHDESAPDDRRRLGHDVAGEAYPTASLPDPGDGRTIRPGEPVASRSTEEEARDLLLVRRAKRGDTGAFAELIRANDAGVRSLLWALTGPDDLDAVCAQAYLRAFRGLPLAPATSPRIWLLGIADGTARDVMRRLDQHRDGPGRTDPPIPVDLPADERLVVAAVDAVGLTPREAARLVGGGVEQTRDLLQSGRKRSGTAAPPSDVPEHGPRFWEDLGRRLLVEVSAPAATRPRSVRPSASEGTGADTSSPPTLTDDGRHRETMRGLAVRVSQQHPRTFPWRRLGVGVAVVGSIAVIAALALSLAGRASHHDAGLGATVAKTLDQLDAALARDTEVRGTVRVTGTDPALTPGVYRFTRSDAGSWRMTAADGSLEDGYDVGSAVAATIRRRAGASPTATVRRGLAPGPPAATGTTTASMGDVLGDVIRRVRAGTGGTVLDTTEPVTVTTTSTSPTTRPGSTTTSPTGSTTTSTTLPGRAVWVVTTRLAPSSARPPLAGAGTLGRVRADRAELVADKSLDLPTKLTLSLRGRTVATVRFSGLSISQQPAETSSAPTVKPGAVTTTTDSGFTPVEIGHLATGSGPTPPTPSYLPGGYVLASAAVTHDGRTVVVCYRNGSRQLVLTRQPLPGGRPVSTDPFTGTGSGAPKPAGNASPDSIEVASGAFAGRKGYAATSPIGHVWVNGPDAQVVVAGDPPIDQLTKVLSSLR